MPKRRQKKKKINKYILLIIFAVLIFFFCLKCPSNSPSLKILSPENRTYYTNNVILSVRSSESAKWISNSFDSHPNVTECEGCSSYGRYDLKFENGIHTISVYASDKEDRITVVTVTFTVKT